MAKPDTSAYQNFEQISGRLDEIIGIVKDKDTSLERSLDLFDEAIALGSKAVDMVDTTDFTEGEKARLQREAQAVAAKAASQTDGGSSDESSSDGKLE